MNYQGNLSLRVLSLCWEYPPEIAGGMGVACYKLNEALRAQGVAVEVWQPARRPVGAKLIADTPLPSSYAGYGLEGAVQQFAKECLTRAKSLKVDCIHAHDWLTFPAALALKRITGIPVVAHFHSSEFDRSDVWSNETIELIELDAVREADAVVAVSGLLASTLASSYGSSDQNVRVVYNGFDEAECVVHRLPLAERARRICFVGRLTPQKGLQYFLGLARKVTEQRQDVKFCIVGEGELRVMAELGARDLVAAGALEFLGFRTREEVLALLAGSTALVLPSTSEPFGLAYAEAISVGTPVVATRSCGIAEIVSSAAYVDCFDVDAMARIVSRLIDDPAWGDQMSRLASKELLAWPWQRAANALSLVFQSVKSSDSHLSKIKPLASAFA